MRVLLLGATGMLGQSIRKNFSQKSVEVIGIARTGAEINADIANTDELIHKLEYVIPDAIINAAAITDLQYCEQNILEAYKVNSRICSCLADYSHRCGSYLVQISTDHYYTEDGCKKHDEESPIYLVNEYARTKYLGECLTRCYDNSLVVRTNIVGFRGKKAQPTFLEWVMQSIMQQQKMTLFNDFYTSSIHVKQLAEVLYKVICQQPRGVLNIASSEVTSKKEFILKIASAMQIQKMDYVTGTVKNLSGAKRAESLGLDVNKAEKLLQITLPGLDGVVASILQEYGDGQHEIQ